MVQVKEYSGFWLESLAVIIQLKPCFPFRGYTVWHCSHFKTAWQQCGLLSAQTGKLRELSVLQSFVKRPLDLLGQNLWRRWTLLCVLVDQMWTLKDVCFWYVTYFSIDMYKGRIQTQIRQEHKPSLDQLSQELVSTVNTVKCSAYFGLSSETKCEKSVWVFSLVLSNQASIWKASWTNEPTYRYGLLLEAIGSLRMI